MTNNELKFGAIMHQDGQRYCHAAAVAAIARAIEHPVDDWRRAAEEKQAIAWQGIANLNYREATECLTLLLRR